jgi:hypothetical protein
MISFVYVIGPSSTGDVARTLVKIGVTVDVRQRLQAFQCGSPVLLSVLWAVPGEQPLERWLHAALHGRREHGEWFDLGPDPVKIVRDTLGPDLVHVTTSRLGAFPITASTDDLCPDEDEDPGQYDPMATDPEITGRVRRMLVSDYGIPDTDIYAAFDPGVRRPSIRKAINRVRKEIDN